MQAGQAATDLAQEFAEFLATNLIAGWIIPQAEKHALQAAIAALALAGQSLAESGKTTVDQAHPDLLETRLPAESEIRGARFSSHQFGDPIRVRISLRGQFLADPGEEPRFRNMGRLVISTHRIQRAGQGSLKGNG